MSTINFAREEAARVWCKPETEKIEMDPVLCEEFAKVIHIIKSQPYLGNATTRELLEEITARIEVSGDLDYKTVDSD